MTFEEWWAQETASFDISIMDVNQLAREVWFVAQAFEREACAKVCADRAKDEPGKLPTPEAYKDEAMLCAAYIRSRSN